MDSTGIRIRLATILAGIGIAVIAGLIISVVANYFFDLSYSFSFLGIILVIGSGPVVIGQSAEFDYAGTQACRILRERSILSSIPIISGVPSFRSL